MTMGLFRAYPESKRPFAFLIRDSNLLLGSYLVVEKSSLSFLSNIVFLALSFYDVLAGFSRPQVLNLRGRIVPSDFSIRTVRSRHVPYCVRRRQHMKLRT
jgi:hypothetical protein